jgi:hypothetical protein
VNLADMERENSQLVLDDLREMIPENDLFLIEVPCDTEDATHWGIVVGNPEEAWTVFYRCDLTWWTKLVQRSQYSRLGGPLSNYLLATIETRNFGSAMTGPSEAASNIAAQYGYR